MAYLTQTVGGRTYYINQPSGSPTKGVIMLHGLTGSGIKFYQGLSNYDPTSHYVIFANGQEITAGVTTSLYWSPNGRRIGRADMDHIEALRGVLDGEGVTDFYLMGHSNGGSMAMQMAAVRPSLWAGVMAVSGQAPAIVDAITSGDCPLHNLHGLSDTTVPYSDGEDAVNRFIAAGYTDVQLIGVDAGHAMAELNASSRVINELEEFMGV